MDLLPINVGKLSAIVNEKTRTVNTDSAVMVHFEVVYGPIAPVGAVRANLGRPPHRVLNRFYFCGRRPDHVGAIAQWPEPCHPAKDSPEQMLRDSHLNHLERDVPCVSDDLRANLGQVSPSTLSTASALYSGVTPACEEGCPGCMPKRIAATEVPPEHHRSH